MEIRVNKLLRGLEIASNEINVSLLGDMIQVPELSPNSKLNIEVIDNEIDLVNMDRLDSCEMMELMRLRNRIEGAIEKREAIIQLEGAMQRLAFVGIKEIKCEGYFISKIEELVIGEINHE